MKFEADFQQFNSPWILQEFIDVIWFEQKSLKSQNIFTFNGNYQFEKLFYSSKQLRGGGCCNNITRAQPYRIITAQKLPLQFSQHLIDNSRIIESKALYVQNKQDKQLVITSIQWFNYNQEHFNTLCLDEQQGSKLLGDIQISLDLILKSTLNYITTSGYLCIELLSICNMLVRVLFSYYNCFQKKKLNSNFKECLENYLAEFENTVKSNVTQCWEFGIEFELEIMNTALAHIPTQLEGPSNLTLGIIQSIFKFKINDALIQSIFEYAKEILKRFVGKVRNPIKKYEVYCTFESMKWNIIMQITQRRQIQNIKIELQNLYIQFIKHSQDWILHYCWIKMITDFLTYRPIVDINILLQDIRNPFERRKKWKDLIKNQCIEQLPYNINLAKCICFPNKSNVFSRNLFLREYPEIGLTELSEFQQYLMKLDKQSDQQFWQFYIIYNKEKENQKDNELNQINQQIQQLFNFIPIFQQFLDYFKSLLEKNQSIIEKMNKLIQNLKNEQNDADTNYKSEILDQNSKIQINTIEMIYVINEINLHIILMTYKLSFITNSLKMENRSVFSDIVDNIKNQYQMQFLTQLNLLPKNLMEFFKNKFFWQDALNNDFNRNSIQNPFDNILNYPFEQLRIHSENILEKVTEYKTIFEDQVYPKYEFISLIQFQNMFTSQVEHFFSLFLGEITNNIRIIINISHDIQNDKKSQYLYQSIHVFLKISRHLLNITKVRFYKNQPFQIIEALSSRRQGTVEDEIQYSSDEIMILVQKQKEQIQKILKEDSQEQKDLSLSVLTDLVKRNINEIKNMKIKNSLYQKNILKQMTLILLKLMKLVDFCDNQFQTQIEIIYAAHQEIFEMINQQNHLDQQSEGLKVKDTQHQQLNQEILSNNISNLEKKLSNFLRLIESFLDSLELKFDIEFDLDLENHAAQTRQEIKEQIWQSLSYFEQNKIEVDKNLKEFFQKFAANYDTEIPYIDIYQFLDILQIFDFKDSHLYQQSSDLSNDDQAYINFVQCYKNLSQVEFDPLIQQQEEQKIKQCLCFHLIKISSIILEEHLQIFSKKLIITIWIKEKDQRVKQLLQNEELIEIQNQLYSRNLESFQKEIELNVKTRLQDFDEYHNQILQEDDDEKKQQLKIKLQDIETDLDQYLLNISDMQAKLQINITTLIELRRELNNVKQNLLKLEQKLDDTNLRIARLTGKKFEELLEIRRKNYLDRMNKNQLEQIYVEQHFRLDKNYQEQDSKYDIPDLIRYFLKEQRSQVMLIYGSSGVGKTTAMNKIEKFIWQNQQYLGRQQKIIPISTSLAYLQMPTINLFKEILMQDKYGFNENQITEFKESLIQNDYQVLFLLDSYDEMSMEFKYQNLYITNRFFEIKSIKLIIFCQKEFIKQQYLVQKYQNLNGSQYQTWFNFNNKLVEAELLELNKKKIRDFLQQYTKLSVLKEIQNFQNQIVKQFQYKQNQFFESENDWNNIKSIIDESRNQSEQSLLNYNQLDKIINYLKQKNKSLNQNQVQIYQIPILRENLQRLWSFKKYQLFTKNLQINELMKIPYLLTLIVDVLPKLDKNYSEKQQNFIQNYREVKQNSILSNKILSRVNSPHNQKFTDQQGWKQFLQSCHSEIKSEIEKNIKNFHQKGLFTKAFNNSSTDNDLNLSTRSLNVDFQDLQLIHKALKQNQITIYDFLDRFSQEYLEKHTLNLKFKGKIQDEENFKQDVYTFAESFSLEMISNQDLSVQYKPQGQLQLFKKFSTFNEENCYNKYFDDKDINKEYFSLIRSALLIIQRGDSFSFCHEKSPNSMPQRLYIIQQINGEENIYFKKKQIEILKQSWLNQEKFNLSQIQYKQVLQILKEKLINKKSFKKKLILLIQISAQYDMIQVASNIISVLGFITKDLTNIPLQGIRLQNTSLIGIDFSNSDLSKSIFYNVNISDCNFTGSKLNNAEWQNIINYNIQREIKNCHSVFQFYKKNQMVIYSTGKKFMQLGLENGQQPLEIFEPYQNLNCYDISNDGQNIAYTLIDSCEIQIWNIPEKRNIMFFKEHVNNVYILSFSKQNSFLASGGNDNKIIIWNWQKQSIITEIDIIGKKLKNLVFSYNNDYIALHFTTEFIQLNSGDKWTPLKVVNNIQEKITVFAFSFDQMMATVSLTDNKSQIIWLFNLKQKEKERKLKGHQNKINYLLFLSDKRSLISGGDDFFIMLWNYQTGEFKGRVQQYTHKIQFLNISKNNRILGYYNEKKSISFIDLDAFQSVHQLKHPSKEISQILFSKDGLILVSCNQSKNITLWDMKGGKQMKKIKEKHDNKVLQIAFTQNGKFLAYAVKKEIILLKNFQDDSSRENRWETKETIKKIKFSKDDKYLAYLCEEDDSEITLIPLEGNLDKKIFQNKNNQQKIKILDFCFASDSQIFIYAEKSIFSWNYIDERQNPLFDLDSVIKCFAFSSFGRYFASLDDTNTIKYYDLRTRNIEQIKQKFLDVNCIAFSTHEDVTHLAIGMKRQIQIYNFQQEVLKFNMRLDHHLDIEILQFSPNGFLLASVFKDKTIKIFDIYLEQLIFTLPNLTNLQLINSENPNIMNFLNEKLPQK
ncbi:unnamed protein product [Paramecium primaurelia]|uniref:NACHT domain-containing protein n=1 Tax=Paramecium primaurelia TaxID=5886 RepID=A0A8S1NVX4_PARPR|nr:unnamed protein product [Paramecium primaurelia]